MRARSECTNKIFFFLLLFCRFHSIVQCDKVALAAFQRDMTTVHPRGGGGECISDRLGGMGGGAELGRVLATSLCLKELRGVNMINLPL